MYTHIYIILLDFLGIWWNGLKPTVNYFLMIMIVGQYHPQSTAIQKLTSQKNNSYSYITLNQVKIC